VTTRIVVGLIALPFVLVPIWLGGLWSLLLFLVIAVGAGYEFYALLAHGDHRPAAWIGLPWIVLLVATGWQPGLPLTVPILAAGLIGTLVYALFQVENPMGMWMATSLGAIYLGVMMAQALALRLLLDGLWWFLYALLITWVSDSAAYFAGVTLGRHRLWPRLSPKKTWEGTVAGWLAAALTGGLLAFWFPLSISVPAGVALGALAGIFALFGDLSISMIKRQVKVKDSGHLFPGHGGVLDRLDSILFVLPLVYQFAYWLAR
jgi:phosphatidate cytidylyltransferase